MGTALFFLWLPKRIGEEITRRLNTISSTLIGLKEKKSWRSGQGQGMAWISLNMQEL